MAKFKYLARYMLAIMGSVAMAIVYGLKVNLSVAIVMMVNNSLLANNTGAKTSSCPPPPGTGTQKPEDGPFDWDEAKQGMLLSCYFWGYMVALLPGAILAERLSAKWVMFFSVSSNVICTLLTPIVTVQHYIGLIVLRVIEGIGGGVTFPAMHCMIGQWAPPSERSTISTIIYSGTSYGTGISILMAGELCALWGWESVFYVMGGLSCIWMIFWIIFAGDTPAKTKIISEEEKNYIMDSLGTKAEAPPCLPLKAVLKSIPFWAIFVAHICGNWGWYLYIICCPMYMKQILKFSIKDNGRLSAIPYFILIVFIIALGKFFDAMIAKKKLSVTWARKIATIIASVIPAACLIGMCFMGCRHALGVFLMCLGIVTAGAMFVGYLTNHIDIAPLYAGTLVALTNTFGTISGIVVPIFVGKMTKGNQTIGAWRIIFFVTVALFMLEVITFTIFGSGKEQPWSKGNANANAKDQ